ncbi:MAG: TonB-dependent receptor plug domain-containing protein, partial [Paraprevotella sp.]|nr:TonB-dependent receptor plug domain-containing protein [Paraprevotella sp.]
MKTLKYILFACFLTLSMWAGAQGITRVSGTVQDAIDVLPGVNIVEIDGSNRTVNATVTDMNGNFVLQIKSSKNKLKFSYIGYKTVILPINKTLFNITLEDNAKVMTDVVITAKKKMQTSGLTIPEREVSFAAEGISAKEFEGLGITSVDEALQGRISGLDIVANSGDLGSGTTMRLRGASTVSTLTSSEPLIVVNGNVWNVDQTDFDVSTANDEKFAQLLNINPEDIEDIKVLKDATATAIWGSQGANGVIEIKTKRGHRGKARVTYSLRMTGTYQPKGIDLLTGDQYTMLLKESYFNPTQNDMAANIKELNYDETYPEWRMYNNNTDWVDEVTQIGLRQNHYLSVTGGDETTGFEGEVYTDGTTGEFANIFPYIRIHFTGEADDYYAPCTAGEDAPDGNHKTP